ncbi:DUF3461 family protein [Zobellella maritima]|uniref:DUF3461 family protein n=1 Tax=Zobellella maritima TaxID=2059725 RepID=UPI000E3017BD|nr:DUF3461 family protein [Zobellella maritima]
MSEFPTLTAMGIQDVHEIERFIVRHESAHDELKVYFRHDADSCQPTSLKFRFSHHDGGAAIDKAVSELNRLLGENPSAEDPKAAIIRNLDQFELVMNAKMAEIRQRLERISA